MRFERIGIISQSTLSEPEEHQRAPEAYDEKRLTGPPWKEVSELERT
jgi:hypothetical protein